MPTGHTKTPGGDRTWADHRSVAPLRLPNAVRARREGTGGQFDHVVMEMDVGAAEGSRGPKKTNAVLSFVPRRPGLTSWGVWPEISFYQR